MEADKDLVSADRVTEVSDQQLAGTCRALGATTRETIEADGARQAEAMLGGDQPKAGLGQLQTAMQAHEQRLAERFLEYFDGMSIGSNDMTQLTLGLDRDSAIIAKLFDERDEAVKAMLSMAIKACKARGKYVGICGQGPSDHPELARWLVDQGIDSISLNPDTVVETWMYLAGQSAD